MTRVLLLAGHTIQALPVLESLKSSGHTVMVECETKDSYGYYSRYPDRKILKPSCGYDSPEYLDFVVRCIQENRIEVIIPLFDLSAEFVSRNREQLLRHTRLVMPPYEVFLEGYSKDRLMDLCRRHGFAHPKTMPVTMRNLAEAAAYTGFPALIKPDITTGGRGMTLVRSTAEIEAALPGIIGEYGSCTLQEFIPPGGRQFKAHHFRTAAGKLYGSAVVEKLRYYPESGGSSCCNRTIDAPELAKTTGEVLHALGWEGFADFDLIEDPRDGSIRIMEINPRFPASVKSAFKAGVDYATLYVNYCLGRPLQEYICRSGVYLRYMAFDILWFLKSRNRFKAKPSWFRFFGRNVFYQDGGLMDPLPALFGSWSGIRKLMDRDLRKAKSGVRLN